MIEYTIGCMIEEDVLGVANLERECFSMPWSYDCLMRSNTMSEYTFFVAKSGEQVMGYCGIHFCGEECEITNLAADQEYRNRGIASDLLQAVFEMMRRRAIHAITLEVRKSNQGAVSLYEKHGFICEGVRKNYYINPTEDAMIMWKRFEV